MDVLRPPLINIKGRIYRRNIIKEEQYEEEDLSYMRSSGRLSLCSQPVFLCSVPDIDTFPH